MLTLYARPRDPVELSPTLLLDDGAYEVAASRRAVARSQTLRDVTRDLILTYRQHRFRPVHGGSDAVPSPDGTHDGSRVDGATSPDGSASARPPRGTLGGLARAAKLTAEQRREIARKAAAARWERFRNGIGTGPPDPRLGGLARARTLTPERRKDIARQASQAMWDRVKGAPRPDAS